MESAGEEGMGVREGEEGIQRRIKQAFVPDSKIAKEENSAAHQDGDNPFADFV